MKNNIVNIDDYRPHEVSELIRNHRKTPVFRHGDINQYRGTHGNLRLGRVCKTYRPRPIRSTQGTKNLLSLGMGSVNCLKCFHRWIGVYPEYTLLKDLECKCGEVGYVIKTGQTVV